MAPSMQQRSKPMSEGAGPDVKPGDLVIMDNLNSHKGVAVRQAIHRRRKAHLLPRFLPISIPIEQVFAKLKHLLRKAAARTVEILVTAVGQLLDAYTAQECANYFVNPGYRRTEIHPA